MSARNQEVPISTALKDRRRLWTWCYAMKSWNHASTLLKILPDLALEASDTRHSALCEAIITAYYRPFTSSDCGSPLRANVVPQAFRAAHRTMRVLRNRAAAHSDASFDVGTVAGPLNAVFIRVTEKTDEFEYRYETSRYTLEAKMLSTLPKLIEALEGVAQQHVSRIEKIYTSSWPQAAGNFILNVKGEVQTMWLRMPAKKQ